MAAESGRAADALAETLFEEPYRFDFFQAVRLLERLFPERAPVGRSGGGGPSEEVVRFRTRPSLAFPASQIHSITSARAAAEGGEENGRGDTDERPEMFVNFMGLTGPSGALPHHYTEELIERASPRNKDTAYWEFLDIFNHRMISLFYRAWEKYRFHIAYERGGRDQLTQYLFDLVGLGTRGLRGRLLKRDGERPWAEEDERAERLDEGLLFYAGLVAQRPRSASSVAAVLGDQYGVRAEVEQFSGQWLELDADALTCLGAREGSGLGTDFVIGERVWDAQSKFRLRFGPLSLAEFVEFLPGGSRLDSAVSITRLLVGLEFDFDVELVLKSEEVPEWSLDRDPDAWPMLGWTSWLKTGEFAEGDDPSVVLPIRE